NWEQLVKAYLLQIADRLAIDATVEELAKKITAEAKSDDERLALLVRYVQDHLTYKEIEFGRRARVPSPPAEVLKTNYGDWKDHSLLLVQLLKAVGIEANMALANLDEPVDAGFPSLEQFNHVIVYLPKTRQFIDCTDKDDDLPAISAPLDL